MRWALTRGGLLHEPGSYVKWAWYEVGSYIQKVGSYMKNEVGSYTRWALT